MFTLTRPRDGSLTRVEAHPKQGCLLVGLSGVVLLVPKVEDPYSRKDDVLRVVEQKTLRTEFSYLSVKLLLTPS